MDLLPGEKITYNSISGEVFVSRAAVLSDISWKEGKIILYKTPIEKALRMLSKRFNVDFVITDPALKENSFTGTFIHQRLDRILEHFRISSGLRFRYIETTHEAIYLFYFFIFLICRSRVCSCLADDQLRCVFNIIKACRLKPRVKLIICSDLSYDDITGISALKCDKMIDRRQGKSPDTRIKNIITSDYRDILWNMYSGLLQCINKIGRASCRERV